MKHTHFAPFCTILPHFAPFAPFCPILPILPILPEELVMEKWPENKESGDLGGLIWRPLTVRAAPLAAL